MRRVVYSIWFLLAALLVVFPWFSPVQAQYPTVCARNVGCGLCGCDAGYECVQNYSCDGTVSCSSGDWAAHCSAIYSPTCILVTGCPVGCHPSYCYETSGIIGCVENPPGNTTGLASWDDCRVVPDTYVCGGCPGGDGPIPTGAPAPTPVFVP
jgi:hypothetical protein